ncbi:hypothetical protein C5167_029657 [Papaver somniferum]|nr:hypothetical protein C5167_029657 [Papaver somniferum]
MAKESKMMIDPKSGFCSETKVYHSLLPPAPLPPSTSSLSISDYVLSLLQKQYTSSTSDFYPERVTAVIDSETGDRGDTAFILLPATSQIPILYLSLLSTGVILCEPAIAFGTSETAHKLPSGLRYNTILLDSPDFQSMVNSSLLKQNHMDSVEEKVSQSDTAAILYSSGTTGRFKGVVLTHRNLIACVAELYAFKQMVKTNARAVMCFSVPFFHVYGFLGIFSTVVTGDTLVVPRKRFDFCMMMKAVEDFKVTVLAVAPPVILAMTRGESSIAGAGLLENYDLSSLGGIVCGGAPLPTEVIVKFGRRFPNIAIRQGYGITEAACAIFRAADAWDCRRLGSTGKLIANIQVKIVDPVTGVALPPGKQGELWAKGPSIMKGYVGEEAESTLDSEGWLKTGDLCYIDNEGFLYIVDRLKELIKYKGYQVRIYMQVPPAELEELLHSHPDILDAAVIPYPDEEAGEVPMAFVVRKSQSSIDKTQVMDFISKHMPISGRHITKIRVPTGSDKSAIFCTSSSSSSGCLAWKVIVPLGGAGSNSIQHEDSNAVNNNEMEMLLSFNLHDEKFQFIQLPAKRTTDEQKKNLLVDYPHLLEFKGSPCIARIEKVSANGSDYSHRFRVDHQSISCCCCCCKVHLYRLKDNVNQVWVNEESFGVRINSTRAWKGEVGHLAPEPCCFCFGSTTTPPTRICSFSDQILLYWFKDEYLQVYNLRSVKLQLVVPNYPKEDAIFGAKMKEPLHTFLSGEDDIYCSNLDYQLHCHVENFLAVQTFIPEGVEADDFRELVLKREDPNGLAYPVTGVALPRCKKGELWAKGPPIMKGYVGEEAEGMSSTLDSEGWLRTGNLCYIDNEGFLYIVDRLKELIKYKGYQVPPAELEGLLHSHPDILGAAVIPYPDEEAGEMPMAFVVRKSQSLIDKTQVIDFISKQLCRKIKFHDKCMRNLDIPSRQNVAKLDDFTN